MKRRSKTITITITGPQGSGKSFLAEAIARQLEGRGAVVDVDDGHAPRAPFKDWYSPETKFVIRTSNIARAPKRSTE